MSLTLGKSPHETGKFLQWYIPREDVRTDALEPSERRVRDPFKGETQYYHVRSKERVERDAAWTHVGPSKRPDLGGLVAFQFDSLDAWFEEDDPIRGHPRDPYHRFDCRHTSEHVVVRVGGEVIAETRRAIKLLETNLPPRYYVPIADVRAGCLIPSESPRTYCPYKGEAAYFHVRGGARTVSDGAWTPPRPTRRSAAHLQPCQFLGEGHRGARRRARDTDLNHPGGTSTGVESGEATECSGLDSSSGCG